MNADLVEPLESTQVTVFAPTNGAFRRLANSLNCASETDLVAGLNQVDPTLLPNVLKYHVLAGVQHVRDVDFGATEVVTLMENTSVSLFKAKYARYTLSFVQGNGNIPQGLRFVLSGKNFIIYPITEVLLPVDASALANLCSS